MARPADLPGPEHYAHGTRARYVSGCRCADCRAANSAAYHERQARAKELAAKLAPAPAVPVEQQWTPPGGEPRTRTYRVACPGVLGQPCPKKAHLRRDSKGGCCGHCRGLLVWNGLVDAEPARRHLVALSRKGVGYKQVADAAGVATSIVGAVLARKKTKLRKSTADRLLDVTVAAAADHATVSAAKTWRLVDKLLARGFTKGEIATRLGRETPALQVGRRRVLVKTAHAIAKLEASEAEPRPSRRRRRALRPGERCDECEGLAYRRPNGGRCRRCGEAWAPEVVALEAPAGGSSLSSIE